MHEYKQKETLATTESNHVDGQHGQESVSANTHALEKYGTNMFACLAWRQAWSGNWLWMIQSSYSS